ncbi:type II secretion system ATPase GspE [Marinibaculum pumilum]|uniref:Type II secretion system protein E n=1 Tax=Marinibaculum pumilum TaxID=1766165 RepID=A0ABV7L1B4_9PROT
MDGPKRSLNGGADIESVLANRGLLNEAALDRLRRLEAESGERLDRIAAKLGMVSDSDLAGAYADALGRPLVRVEDFPTEAVLPERLRAAFVKRSKAIPLAETEDSLVVAMADPLDETAVRAMQFATGKRIDCRAALPADIDTVYERLYGEGRGANDDLYAAAGEGDDAFHDSDLERLKDLASEAPVIRLVNSLVGRAVEMHASDIHIESMEAGLRVRYRIDGVLREMDPPPARLRSAIISRIKIMSKLDIAERRLAQDGRIRLAVRGKEIDFRVSTTPAIHGESVVLRILDRDNLKLEFAALGFDDTQLPAFLEALHRPYGIVLVTGPTGSGKTTTLYAALTELNRTDTKILTAEDPVEYMLEGINQVQVKADIGLTFASALRSFLRQDPDILMIGEIRDLETAQIAVQAALTGHLVLSTVHTNDAASAVTRLLDMGIENYLLTSTVNAVLGQRLVRRLCPSCREAYVPAPELVAQIDLKPGIIGPHAHLYRPKGCGECTNGFAGRTTVLELMVLDDAIRALVMRRAEAREIQLEAVRNGMQTMYADGLRKALAGITTIEEVLRVSRST